MVTRSAFAGCLTSLATIALLATLVAFTSNPAAAQTTTLNGALELTQVYRPDVWQPVRLQLRNNGDAAIDGTAVLPLSDARSPTVMRVPVLVPPHALVRVTVWGYFPATDVTKKQTNAPPLSIAEWRGADGALLGRTPVVGLPLAGKPGEGAADLGAMILLINERAELPDEEHDVESLAAMLSDSAGIPLTVPAIDLPSLSRQPQALCSMRAVVLDSIDPAAVDVAQREVLLSYVRGGGTLVIAAPIAADAATGTWLSPLLPVRQIGSREAGLIETSPDAPPLKLRRPQRIVEAIDGDGQVLLRGRDYVHVAVQTVGLGKVIFISFPINALEPSQPQAALLWQQLLSLDSPRRQWNDVQLGEARHAVLGSMIGRKVAPWRLAAALAGAYVMVILAVQGVFRGAARPRAFAASIVAALLMSAALMTGGAVRHGGGTLQSARLALVDVTESGVCERQESVAFAGSEQPQLSLRGRDEQVMIRPALADAGNRPSIRQQPFAVEKAGAFAERIERVWEACGGTDATVRLDAVGRLGPQGVTLEINNELGQPIASPLLLCDRRAMSISDLPAGRSTVSSLRLNPRDDFSNSSMLASEQSNRRAKVVKASITPMRDEVGIKNRQQPPMLVGWIDENPDAGLIRVGDDQTVEQKSMTMVRTPLRIEPPAVGARISVPSPLVAMDLGPLPYDLARGESVPSQETGQWLIGFSAPPQIGQIKPASATLAVRVSLPGHQLSLYKSQCAGGKPTLNRNGELVAQWTKEVGLKNLTISCGPGDFDREGGIWLLMDVQPAAAQSAGAPWQIEDLSVAIEGEVVAPPKLIRLDPPIRPSSAER